MYKLQAFVPKGYELDLIRALQKIETTHNFFWHDVDSIDDKKIVKVEFLCTRQYMLDAASAAGLFAAEVDIIPTQNEIPC